MKDEEWKWINGFEGIYKISNRSRLMSFYKSKSGRIRSAKNKNGDYLRTCLSRSGGGRKVSMHVLVAEAFLGDIPPGHEVHHKDGNKQNNSVENLQIISKKEHIILEVARNPNRVKGMNQYNKYERPRRVRQYTQEGQFIAEYVNSKVASHYTGVCSRNIIQVASKTEYKPGKARKQAGGYVWIYADEDKE